MSMQAATRRTGPLVARLCLAMGLFGSLLAASRLDAQTAPAGDTLVLSLAEARDIALERSPELLSAAQRPVMARGELRTAGLPPFNPELSFESRSPDDGVSSRFEAELGLKLEIAGQRGLRTNAAEAGYAASLRGYEDEVRKVLTEIGRVYIGLVAAERRLDLVQLIGDLNAQVYDAVRTRLTEGEVSVLDANLAAIESARARSRALEAGSARLSTALELGRMLGIDPSTPLRTAGPDAVQDAGAVDGDLEDLVRAALARRPDLAVTEMEIERARQEARLARREWFPNLRLAGLATREDPFLDPRFGVSAGIVLPLFNRNQGVVDRNQAELAQAEAVRSAAELSIRVEVEEALRKYVSARSEVEILEAEVLSPVRENQRLLEMAYQEGLIDLATLLLLRNQLLDAELSYWDAWERRERARIELESATGEILEGIMFDAGGDR